MSGSSRPPSASTRDPLETLVHSLVPALAPPKDASGKSSRLSSRLQDPEAEKYRRDKVRKLVEQCREILNQCVLPWDGRRRIDHSPAASTAPLSTSSLAETARRILAESGPEVLTNGSTETGSDKAMRFGAAWNKLGRGVSLPFDTAAHEMAD